MEKDTEKNGINSGRDPITGKFVEGNKLGGDLIVTGKQIGRAHV